LDCVVGNLNEAGADEGGSAGYWNPRQNDTTSDDMKLEIEETGDLKQRTQPSAAVCCAVVYEDTASRDRALRLCDDLVRKLWHDLDFDFSWWRFDYLEDPGIARLAAESALWSDITMFSTGSGGDLPVPVRRWVDDWSGRRLTDESLLVALIGTGVHRGDTPLHSYLRQKAALAHMDFLPPSSGATLAKGEITLKEIEARATRKTALLNEILRHPDLSNHWGINE